MNALPQWTEIGSDSGLDPLGMMRPSELIYQPLLAGISTVTNRYRYYSFHTWFLDFYAREYANTNPDVFKKVLRHAEALFALIGQDDHGLTGSNWVSRYLNDNQNLKELNFGKAARSEKNGLLQNQGGALSAVYGAQIAEMGLIKWRDDHDFLVPTKKGGQVVKAFDALLGSYKDLFETAIKTGIITRADLKKLAFLAPSKIDARSLEWAALKDALLGLREFENTSSLRRRDSLRRMLIFTKDFKQWPEADELRWHWYQDQIKSEQYDDWLIYHINDLLLVGYEGLLKYCLNVMAGALDQTTTWEVVEQKVLQEFENTAADFIGVHSLDGSEFSDVKILSEHGHGNAVYSEDDLRLSVRLIQKSLSWAGQNQALIDNLFQHSEYFQSLRTELKFLKSLDNADFFSALRSILIDRVLKRHLWVAARKLKAQSKYTFLFEPVEGRIRFLKNYGVWMGYPRIVPALGFLSDMSLIDKETGLTELGAEILAEL